MPWKFVKRAGKCVAKFGLALLAIMSYLLVFDGFFDTSVHIAVRDVVLNFPIRTFLMFSMALWGLWRYETKTDEINDKADDESDD